MLITECNNSVFRYSKHTLYIKVKLNYAHSEDPTTTKVILTQGSVNFFGFDFDVVFNNNTKK